MPNHPDFKVGVWLFWPGHAARCATSQSESTGLLVIRLCVMKGELLMGEMVVRGGVGGGCVAAWRSSRDGKGRPGNGNRYRFRARQIGLNNVAQTHSTSQSHARRREDLRRPHICRLHVVLCVFAERESRKIKVTHVLGVSLECPDYQS